MADLEVRAVFDAAAEGGPLGRPDRLFADPRVRPRPGRGPRRVRPGPRQWRTRGGGGAVPAARSQPGLHPAATRGRTRRRGGGRPVTDAVAATAADRGS